MAAKGSAYSAARVSAEARYINGLIRNAAVIGRLRAAREGCPYGRRTSADEECEGKKKAGTDVPAWGC